MANLKTVSVAVSTANTNRDGTGTVGTIYTAGSLGTLVTKIQMKARASSAAGMLRMFLHDGTSYHPYLEFLVAAITASSSVAAFERTFLPTDGIWLPNGWSVRFSTEKAETFDITITGDDAV